jgi:response regulator RpfG family c-di-GMP phosphodiesterase
VHAALLYAIVHASKEALGKMELISLTFAKGGICPFDPETVLRRVPPEYPMPKAGSVPKPAPQLAAEYSKMSGTYEQTKYVKEAKDQAREATTVENAAMMEKVLDTIADTFLNSADGEEAEALERAAELLHRLAPQSLRLLSSPQV